MKKLKIHFISRWKDDWTSCGTSTVLRAITFSVFRAVVSCKSCMRTKAYRGSRS